MEGFKPIFDDCQEKFGALEEGDEAELTINLTNGDTIETNAVGIDFDDNVCRHFTWEEINEETIRELVKDEPHTVEEMVEDEEDFEIGEPFMMMNGLLPWSNVQDIEIDTQGLF